MEKIVNIEFAVSTPVITDEMDENKVHDYISDHELEEKLLKHADLRTMIVTPSYISAESIRDEEKTRYVQLHDGEMVFPKRSYDSKVAKEILDLMKEIYFGKEYIDFRAEKGSNGTRDLVMQKIREKYGL